MGQTIFNVTVSICLLLNFYRVGGIMKQVNTIEGNAPWLLRSR
jgi:hypothetical protein